MHKLKVSFTYQERGKPRLERSEPNTLFMLRN